jgi:hypothetical protein
MALADGDQDMMELEEKSNESLSILLENQSSTKAASRDSVPLTTSAATTSRIAR